MIITNGSVEMFYKKKEYKGHNPRFHPEACGLSSVPSLFHPSVQLVIRLFGTGLPDTFSAGFLLPRLLRFVGKRVLLVHYHIYILTDSFLKSKTHFPKVTGVPGRAAASTTFRRFTSTFPFTSSGILNEYRKRR